MPGGQNLLIPVIDVISLGPKVAAQAGIVYSCDPERAECSDDESYFVKGPDPNVVFAELVGCTLAQWVGIPVPKVAICTIGDTKLVGSQMISNSMRDVAPWLSRPEKISNFNDIYRTIVLDAWLANTDRNLYNVLGKKDSGGGISLVMIDFEKSVALRGPSPIMEAAAVNEREIWPRGELGQVLRQRKPLHPPTDMYDRIGSVNERRCTDITKFVSGQLGNADWYEHSVHSLMSRARRIQEIAERVWLT